MPPGSVGPAALSVMEEIIIRAQCLSLPQLRFNLLQWATGSKDSFYNGFVHIWRDVLGTPGAWRADRALFFVFV